MNATNTHENNNVENTTVDTSKVLSPLEKLLAKQAEAEAAFKAKLIEQRNAARDRKIASLEKKLAKRLVDLTKIEANQTATAKRVYEARIAELTEKFANEAAETKAATEKAITEVKRVFDSTPVESLTNGLDTDADGVDGEF